MGFSTGGGCMKVLWAWNNFFVLWGSNRLLSLAYYWRMQKGLGRSARIFTGFVYVNDWRWPEIMVFTTPNSHPPAAGWAQTSSHNKPASFLNQEVAWNLDNVDTSVIFPSSWGNHFKLDGWLQSGKMAEPQWDFTTWFLIWGSLCQATLL